MRGLITFTPVGVQIVQPTSVLRKGFVQEVRGSPPAESEECHMPNLARVVVTGACVSTHASLKAVISALQGAFARWESMELC